MGFWRPLLVLAQEPQGGYKAGLHLPCLWPDGVSSQKFCLSCISASVYLWGSKGPEELQQNFWSNKHQ